MRETQLEPATSLGPLRVSEAQRFKHLHKQQLIFAPHDFRLLVKVKPFNKLIMLEL